MKGTLRQELAGRRAALSGEERVRQARAIIDRLDHWPQAGKARVLLGYAPMASEVDLLPFLEARARRGARILLPRVQGHDLRLHDWLPGDELERGALGVREPKADAPLADPAEVELALIPGIGFDRAGHRLGFGRGFYDRLLGRVPLPLRVGVAFDAQVVDRLPAEEHDQRMGWLVTATQLLRFPEAP